MKSILVAFALAYGTSIVRAQTNLLSTNGGPSSGVTTQVLPLGNLPIATGRSVGLPVPTNAIVVALDDEAKTLLHKATEDTFFKKDALFNTLLGAVLAVAVGLIADLLREKRETRRKKREDVEFERNAVLAIRRELEAMGRLYQAGIGQFLKGTTEGQYFPVRLALTQDWFTVFNANAVHLGRIDAEISRRVIFSYSLLKGLIEEFRINNEGLTTLEQAQRDSQFYPADERLANRLEEQRIQQIKAQLVAQFARIKKAEQELKTAVDELLALLDQRGIK